MNYTLSRNDKSKNIIFCVSCLVQGVQCPAKRRGKTCPMAHTIGEVNPGKCNRGGGGEECRCKDRKYPFTCHFIHNGETKEKYAERLGFDPKHEKYNDYSYKQIKQEIKDCRKLVDELKGKIAKFDLKKIPETDKAYVRRTQNSIRHLSIKTEWLRSIEQNDEYYLSPKKKAENRRIVRTLFKEGKYVTVDRSFESKDDADEYEDYYDEMMKDFYDELWEMERERGIKIPRRQLDTCEAELRIMKDWIGMAIAKWDEEEEAKKKTTANKIERRKVEKNVWTEEGGGSYIVHTENKRKLQENVAAISKAEHERLHKVVVPNEKTVEECYRKMDDDMRREHKTRINGLVEKAEKTHAGWGDVIKGLVHENGDYSDEEDTLDEWLFDNHRIDRYGESMNYWDDDVDSMSERLEKDRWDDKRDKWHWGGDSMD